PQRALEQELRVIEYVVPHADLGEEPHPLHVIAVLQEVLAHNTLGELDLAIGEHAESRADLDREALEPSDVFLSALRIRLAAGEAIENAQRAPARRQRRVQRQRLLEGRNRRARG